MKNLNRFVLLFILTVIMNACCSDDAINFNVYGLNVTNFNIENQENTNNIAQQNYALRVILNYDFEEDNNGLWCSNSNYVSNNAVTNVTLTANNIINEIQIGENINELFKLKVNNVIFNDFNTFISTANNIDFTIYDFIFDDTLTIEPITTSFTIELTFEDNTTLSSTTESISIN